LRRFADAAQRAAGCRIRDGKLNKKSANSRGGSKIY